MFHVFILLLFKSASGTGSTTVCLYSGDNHCTDVICTKNYTNIIIIGLHIVLSYCGTRSSNGHDTCVSELGDIFSSHYRIENCTFAQNRANDIPELMTQDL